MKIIFLDIDGVLNGHQKQENGFCGTTHDCVLEFNRVLDAVPDAKIVITSSWRYIAGFCACTTRALENVLLTHGVKCQHRIIGHTRPDLDAEVSFPNRGKQISEYLSVHVGYDSYVVIDDCDFGITAEGHPFVNPFPDSGLSSKDADEAIAILQTIGCES